MTPERWKRLEAELDRLEPLDADAQQAALAVLAQEDAAMAKEVGRMLRPAAAALVDAVAGAWQVAAAAPLPANPNLKRPQLPGYRLHDDAESVKFGGMGAVYFGVEETLRRPVAVKVLLHELRHDKTLLARFRDESLICAQLQHPGVVPVYAVGELADGRPYYVMKLIRGETFTEVLKRRASPAADLLPNLAIIRRVCEALGYAHGKRIVHRDLKPSNIMVGQHGEVLLVDWGLAKKLSDGTASTTEPLSRAVVVERDAGLATQSGLGSLPYLAPEQAAGLTEAVDERSDVFGLGAILCVLLTGQPPYIGASEAAVERKALRGDLDEAYDRLATCGQDPDLVAITRACLAKAPAERPADATAVADRLTAYLAAVDERRRRAEIAHAEAAVQAAEEHKRRRQRRRYGSMIAAAVLLAFGAWWEYDRVRAGQRREAAERVTRELQRAVTLREQAVEMPIAGPATRREAARLWAEAEASLERAEAAAGAEVSDVLRSAGEALRSEAAQHARERRLLDALSEARDQRLWQSDADFERAESWMILTYATDAARTAYASAFKAYGIDLEERQPADVGANLRQSPKLLPLLVESMDDWLLLENGTATGRSLVAVLETVDPDALRTTLRRAAHATDQPTLSKLSKDFSAADLTSTGSRLLAMGLLRAGDGVGSVRILEAAHKRNPTDFWLNNELGAYLNEFDYGRTHDAIGYFSAALVLRPDIPEVYINLACSFATIGRWSSALEMLDRAEKIDPKMSIVKLIRAQTLGLRNHRGDVAAAFAMLDAILDRVPHHQQALLIKSSLLHDVSEYHEMSDEPERQKAMLTAALAAVDLALTCKPNDTASLVQRAECLAGLERYAEVIEICNGIKSHPQAIALVARSLRNEEQYEASGAILAEALRRYPGIPRLYTEYAETCLTQNRTAEADHHARRAVELNPRNASNLRWYGQYLVMRGRSDEAQAVFLDAARFVRGNAAVLHNIARELMKMEKYELAIDLFQDALAVDATCAARWEHFSDCQYEVGRTRDALASIDKAIALNASVAEFHNKRGVYLVKDGKDEAACAAYEEAVRLQPDNARFHQNMGLLRQRIGPPQAALAALQAVVAINPRDTESWQHLGKVFHEQGDVHHAEECYQLALEHAADDDPSACQQYCLFLRNTNRCNEAYGYLLNHPRQLGTGAEREYLAALIHEDVGRTNEAFQHYRAALALDPTLVNCALDYQYTLFATGHPEAARAVLEELRRSSSADQRRDKIDDYFITVDETTGRFQEALATARGYRERIPADDEEGRRNLDSRIQQILNFIQYDAIGAAITYATDLDLEPKELLLRAQYCYYKQSFRGAARYYERYFAKAGSKIESGYFFQSARAAAAAAAEQTDEKNAAEFRRLSLAFLKKGLDWSRGWMASPDAAVWKYQRRTLVNNRSHLRLLSLHDPAALANLPAKERNEWLAFWKEYDALIDSPPPVLAKKKPDQATP